MVSPVPALDSVRPEALVNKGSAERKTPTTLPSENIQNRHESSSGESNAAWQELFREKQSGSKVHRSVRSSAFVGHPQGAQLVDVAEALGRPLCPGNVAGNTLFTQSVHWSPTGTCQEGQHRTQNSDQVAVP
jgi:hypothetical protein